MPAVPQSRTRSVIDFAAIGHERSLLAASIDGIDLPEDISIGHFSQPTHRDIFRACVELRRDAVSVNDLSVTDWLCDHRLLDKVGGAAAITSIANETHTEKALEYALDCVRESSADRLATEIIQQWQNGLVNREEMSRRLQDISPEPKGSWKDALERATVGSDELASLVLEPRPTLLGEWLCEGDYGIIFAPRGAGKTWFALLIAKAVSVGGQLGEWKAHGQAKVLYVDGEMPPDLMRDRDIGLGSGDIKFLNHDILFQRTGKVLNISELGVQDAILRHCIHGGIKLLILDNLSTLASGLNENDSFDWEQLHNWLLRFRRHRIAVILIHHAGRNREARGTSKREDAAFWVIALDDAKNQADDKRGARFVSRFTKPSRNTQDEIPPLEWHIVTDAIAGTVSVGCKAAKTMDVFRKWIEDGVTECGQLAEEMGVSKGTISKWAKKAERDGWLHKKGREYRLVDGTVYRVLDGGVDGNQDLGK